MRVSRRLWLQREVHRHKLRKTVWSKLLTPLRALLKSRGELPLDQELPGGETFETHPLWKILATCLQFKVAGKKVTRDGVHIKVAELRGMLSVEREACREDFPIRLFSLADSQVGLGSIIKGRSSSAALNQELQQSLPVHIGCGIQSNYGFLPSPLNPGDDPTRHVPLRLPSGNPPRWLFDDLSSEEQRLADFDSWLASAGAHPFQVSGLPSFDELQPILREDGSWKRRRRKQYPARCCKRGATCPESPKAFIDEKPKENVTTKDLSELLAFEKSKNQEAPKRECLTNQEAPKRECLTNTSRMHDSNLVDAKSCPESFARDLPTLSSRAIAALKRVHHSQFIFPKQWKVGRDWLPKFAGYLDIDSGQKGVAKAVVAKGNVWAICFEISDSAAQDVLLPENASLIQELLESHAVFAFGAAIFCSSFSRAVRPPFRSATRPFGLANLSATAKKKVEDGNRHAIWLASLIVICIKEQILFWVENPDSSFIWLLPQWLTLGLRDKAAVFRLDYCVCGTPWRKRAKILTSCQLRGQSIFCSRLHQHRKLVGWSKAHKMSWTRVAQAYPRRLCHWISSALLIDSGIWPKQQRVDVCHMAKLQGARVGEAQNPGPRRAGVRYRRERRVLEEAHLVEAGTAALGFRVWEAFRRWGLRHFSAECFSALSSSAVTLSELLELFGLHLFEEGQSIYLLRQLVTHVQRTYPDFRGHLGKAWQLIAKWESLQPVSHRAALPLVVYQALVALAISIGWLKWAGITVLGFEGICRPGEPLAAERRDLLLPRDLVAENPAVVFLQIRQPKGRKRGLGAVQHVKIVDRRIAIFLEKVFGSLKRNERLYSGTPNSYRRRWDYLLTPASLRSGGAVRAYRADEEIARLLWRMRLKNIETLQHYLQEVGAASLFAELPRDSQFRITQASQLFSSLLDAV